MNTLSDVMTKWQNDQEFRTALKKTKDTEGFKSVLESANIYLPIDELKKVEAMLQLKNQTTLNIDLDKKINK